MSNTVGWCVEIEAKVRALNANVVTEGGGIERTCAHGVRHPVGDLEPTKWNLLVNGLSQIDPGTRDVGVGELAKHRKYRCCPEKCCATWDEATSVDAVREDPR